MIRICGTEFSGVVTENGGDELTVVISTDHLLEDVLSIMKNVKEVINIARDGTETVYSVSRPLSASLVSNNLYAVKFSTKKTETQILEEKNQELSDAIDDILVMMLEE